MEVKPITIVAQPGGKPVSAGHFCTVRLSKPNKQGAITVEIVPSRRVAKWWKGTTASYLRCVRMNFGDVLGEEQT